MLEGTELPDIRKVKLAPGTVVGFWNPIELSERLAYGRLEFTSEFIEWKARKLVGLLMWL